jgi:hypothetical protein
VDFLWILYGSLCGGFSVYGILIHFQFLDFKKIGGGKNGVFSNLVEVCEIMQKYTVVYYYAVSAEVEADSPSDAKLVVADMSLDIAVTEPFTVLYANFPIAIYDEAQRKIQ